jgi:hypothetical protein
MYEHENISLLYERYEDVASYSEIYYGLLNTVSGFAMYELASIPGTGHYFSLRCLREQAGCKVHPAFRPVITW